MWILRDEGTSWNEHEGEQTTPWWGKNPELQLASVLRFVQVEKQIKAHKKYFNEKGGKNAEIPSKILPEPGGPIIRVKSRKRR